MILNLVVGVYLAVFSLIGFIVGIVKGYTNTRKWAGEYLVASLIAISVGAIFVKIGLDVLISGAITLAVAVVLILGCIGISGIIQRALVRAMERRDEFDDSYGAVGVVNRLWGGVVLAIKGFTIGNLILLPVVLVLDFSQISVIKPILSGITESAYWLAVRPILFDLLVLGIMNIAIRHGFASGIASSLWSLLVFALIVGAGFMSYHLVFNSGLFNNASAALAGHLQGLIGNIEFLKGMVDVIAKVIIVIGLFIILAIVIAVISFFVTKVISFARLGSAYYVIDGIFGAMVLFIIALSVMLFFGAIINPIADLDFMKPFTEYFSMSTVAKYVYTDNLLMKLGLPELLPLREWLS